MGAAIWLSLLISEPAGAQSTPSLTGATQYGDSHVVTRTLERFEERVRSHYGKPLGLTLRRNAAIGLEKQYLDFMSQGNTVDYAIVSPVHMAPLSKAARLIEAPFLFRDAAHWKAALSGDALKLFSDAIAPANVMIIGFAGGSVRNIVSVQPVESLAALKGATIRVPGATLWSEVFEALGTTPVVMGPGDVFGALKKGSLAAAEGDLAAIEAAKLTEVAPYLVASAHAFTVRPICFSAKTFKSLPADLQEAILKAGAEAAAYGRELERTEDEARLDALEKDGKLKRIAVTDRAEVKALADPVIAAYAKDNGADALLDAINATK